MKNMSEFISYLHSLDIKLWVEGDRLRYKIPKTKDSVKSAILAELAERKTEVIDFLNQANQATHSNLPPIPLVPRSKELLLSFAQERLWFLNQLMPENPAYNVPAAVRLVGSLNRMALAQSLREIVRRHETLRTTFSMVDGKPVQVTRQLSVDNYQLSAVDLQDLSPDEQHLEVQKLATIEAQRSFNFKCGPLFRTTLLQLHPEEYVLLVTIHHIVTDGWSMGIFVKELSTLYEAFSMAQPSPLPELPIQYADFAQWQRQWLSGELLETQLSYWKQQLTSASSVLEIPGDYPRPPINSFRGATEHFEISSELTQQLKSLTQQQAGVTLFMVLLAAFAILLERYSHQEDIIIGSPIANRRRKEIEPLIGYFANTLALRIDLSGNPTFLELIKQVQQVTVEAYAHQDIPFELLVEALHPERDMSRNPLVQVALVFQNASMPPLALKDLTLSLLEFDSGTTRFDLEFHLWETNNKLVGKLYYYKEIFESATMVRLLGHFRTLLSSIAPNPKQPISEYSLLNEEERHQLLVEWNNTTVDYPQDQCIHQLFEAQVEQTPDAIAVIFEEQQLTYRALNTKANQLAHYLQSLGIKPEVLVGICIERSLEMVIGLLGILKAGGAYVPLDPAYPAARLAFMLEDARVPVLLSQSSLVEVLPKTAAQVVCLDADREALSQLSSDNPISGIKPENLAYVIYTSGSTGKPKGVQIGHSSLLNFLTSMRQQPGLTSADVLLAITTLSFDIAALEVYLPLIVGAKIVLACREDVTDGEKLLEKLNHEGITVMQATPATWHLLLTTGWKSTLKLKILCGGEALPRELATQLLKKGQTIWNLYGPTETTIWSTIAQVSVTSEPSNTVSIGHPIANTQTYILDSNDQPVPVGVPGELHIGGVGLARGYKGRPDLTAEKFIPHPFNDDPNSRLYKTGDLARYLPDGNIEYLGRIDNQVKIRGFRIELGEIEAVLAQHPTVRENAVIVHETSQTDKRLIAYLVPHQEQLIETAEIRAFLKERLPNYMIPSAFVTLEALPLTPNCKIDRRALPTPEKFDSPKKATLPQTEVEQQIATVWQEVLQLDKVGIHDNFFDLGGHSLLIIQVQTKLQTVFAKDISVVELFEHPSIHALAQHLGQTQCTPEFIPEPQPSRLRAHPSSNDIAIIGISGRFPGAADIEAFWQNLKNGVESITFFSNEELLSSGINTATLNKPNYVKAAGTLSDIETFDAFFFDVNPKEAEMTDPQHRLFLECAWEAIENAGYEAGTDEQAIGVYAGVGMNSYLLNNLSPNLSDAAEAYQIMIGNDKDFLPTRVSYKLNLKGPSVNVQTACSTSLVAVHLACQGILNGECDMALAGGVSVRVQKSGYLYQEGMIMSPDGHCRAFDAKAKGTVGGNGVGIVVLKRLEEAIADGDNIHAIIKGSAINNDGALKVGYTAPSVEGQAAVISEAQAIAGVSASTINYIEAHGTGTELGDPIEIAALTKVFGPKMTNQCAIGSLKTNIGHTDAAAGVASLIKTVLALKHQLLPPSLHFEQPNPQIDFANSPFYVNSTLSEWQKLDGTPRRAGVSSFGIGGTNAHVILEEAPAREPSGQSRPWQLLLISAKTPTALETASLNLATYLEEHPEINFADVAYTLCKGRKAFGHRRMLVSQKMGEAATTLRTLEPSSNFQEPETRSVVFMFSGQGAQYVNMGLELYQTEPLFREQIDLCSEHLKPHLGLDLRQVLYPSEDQAQLNQTVITQSALFVIEYALAKLWMAWGIVPEAMIGHSIGEYVAACLAGVFSLEEALSLVAARGQMMQQLPGGTMLAVPLAEKEVQPLLGKGLSLAAINTQSFCVVSGPTELVEALETQLSKQGVECRHLQTSHAFHSEMMAPILASFTERVAQINLSGPQIPYISNVTGNWISADEATDPSYWAKHLRQTVRFADGLQLLNNSKRILLEIGPGRTLSSFAKRHPALEQVVLSSLRHPQYKQSDVAFLLNSLGKFWLAGGEVDWSGFYANERRYRLPLPTYPFERQRYWVEPSPIKRETERPQKVESISRHSRPELLNYVAPRNELEQTIADIWAKALGIESVGIHDDFFDLGGESLLAVQVITKLRDTLQVDFSAHSLLNAPTIAALAELIEQTTSIPERSNQPARQALPSLLVEIQAGNRMKPPLFLTHPVGGHVYFYRELAHYLDSEQPVYGIQAQGLDGETEPLTQVEEMATQYIKAMRVLQPEGPYFLGGSSFGGTIAFEMAQQLHAQEQQVALLTMIDTPGLGQMPIPFSDDAEIIAYLLEIGANVSVSLEALRKLKPDEQLRYCLEEQKKLDKQTLPDLNIADVRHFLHIFKVNVQAMREYQPQIYQGRILFFRAKERDRFNAQRPELAWIDLAAEGIEIYVVPGNHITMNEQPHVQLLAKRLKICLEQAQADD